MKKIIFISLLVFLLDFVSKRIVVHVLSYEKSVIIIRNFFSFTLAKNTGIAFSMLEGNVLFVIIMSLLIVFFLVEFMRKHVNNLFETVSYSFVIGGAIGNLVDRIIYGYVIDFLDFEIFGYDFPVFNFADMFIVVGVIMALIYSYVKGDK